jgi:hypothetical protein
MLNDALQLSIAGIFVLLLKGSLKFLDGKVAVGISIYLREKEPKVMNILLGELGSNIGHC